MQRYERLLKGLEATEVAFSRVCRSTETFRYDPEYYKKQHLDDELAVVSAPDRFSSFKALGLKVDASAFYPAIETSYGSGELPFLRVADVDSVIDFQQCTRIPGELCSLYPTLSTVSPGDIVLTKGGSVARVGLVTEHAAVSRDLIFINSSSLPEEDRIFLYVYLQSDFFNRMLIRSSSQTAQPHLTTTLVRRLPVVTGGARFRAELVQRVAESFRLRDESLNLIEGAEQALLDELGLSSWIPPEPLAYSRRAKDVFAAGRMDAQFFLPKYESLLSWLERNFECRRLRQLGEVTRGKTVLYAEDGLIPIIRSGNLRDLESSNFLRADPREEVFPLCRGDVLVSSIGFGSIGKIQVFDKPGIYGTVSEVTVVRQSSVDPWYLMFFLRSLAGQLQIERFITGATGQLHLYPKDVAQIRVPMLGVPIQLHLRHVYKAALRAHHRSQELRDRTRQAMDIAIKQSEAEAIAFLETKAIA